MRSFLMAVALLSLLAARSVAEPAACAILFRDVTSALQADVTAADLSIQPQSLVPAFRTPNTAAKADASHIDLSRWVVATYASIEERDAAIDLLRKHADIETVEAIRSIVVPHQSAAASQETGWNIEQVGAPAALLEVQGDSTLIVAVIDTGADLTHPDLAAQLWDSGDAPGNATTADDFIDQNGDGFVEEWEKHDDDNNGYVDDQHGYDFTHAPGHGGVGDDRDRDPDPQDDHGHGTHVAGIIAARGSLQGVAPFARLMPVRAAYTTGFGGGILRTNDAAAAIVYAVDNGARVLNLSWGDTVESRLIRAAIDHAIRSGVLVVAAAGNDGEAGAHWPAADPRVVGVGSSMRNGERSAFSNFDVGVDLLAPGEEAPFPQAGIVSLEPLQLVPAGRGERRGTSMAAPHVAGVAAIVLSRNDQPDMPTARALLLDAAQRSGADWSSSRGHGRVDALAAVRQSSVLLAMWHGPDAPYLQGQLRADATVWGAALQRFEIVAQHASSGMQVSLRPWESASYWRQRLVETAFVNRPEGTWHLILRVEDTTGFVRERRMRFDVDDSPPKVDSLFVHPVWRGSQPQWLLSAQWDEAVSLRVLHDAVVVFSNAGLAKRHQEEIGAEASLAGSWNIEFRNEAGLGDTLQRDSPVALETWQPLTLVRDVSATSKFLPQSAWGQTPLGRRIVWGQGLIDGARGHVQAAQVVDDTLQIIHDPVEPGRPVSYGDVNGDGRADLLIQNGLSAEWWTTCAGCEFPDQQIAGVRTERVLGFFQLDADAALETILSTRDSLLLFDDATQGVPTLLQVLVNPTQQGFAFWGGDAAVGDLDGDARIELVCGDGEGNVSVFEAEPGQSFVLQQVIDTQGSYAYDLTALPPDGFIVGRQRTRSVTGDGFDTTSYEFLRYRFAAEFVLEESWAFAVATGDLNAGSTLVPGNPPLLVLVRGDDLYLQERVAGIWQKRGWFAGADGEPPVIGDLQGNGTTHWVLPTSGGSRVLSTQSQMAPAALASTSLGAGRLALSWLPGDGSEFRVQRRADAQAWQVLGETTSLAWVDSTAPAYVDHEYEVLSLSSGMVVGTSNRIWARSQPLPRLRAVEVVGPQSLRCWFSNAMNPHTLQPRHFDVTVAGTALPVLEATVAEEARSVLLLLDEVLPCDSVQVAVSSETVRDAQNGMLDPQAATRSVFVECPDAAFLVQQVAAEGNGFLIHFSEPPDAQASLNSTYSVTWDAVPQAVSAVQPRSARAFFLEMTDPLVGRGVPYLLSIDPRVQSASGQELQLPAQPFEVLFSGRGAPAVYVAPNPVRAATGEVAFLEAADDTRVTVYNLEGERIVTLDQVRGGALRWDLRTQAGSPVQSGTYLYVARDATGSATGRIVIIR